MFNYSCITARAALQRLAAIPKRTTTTTTKNLSTIKTQQYRPFFSSTKPSTSRLSSKHKPSQSAGRFVKQKNQNNLGVHHTQRRFYEEYDRPFSNYKGVLDAFLIGSRHNYTRPSVTHAAGLGNTTLRHTKLHVDDIEQSIPLHKSLPAYILKVFERRPGMFLSFLMITAIMQQFQSILRTEEIYRGATESILSYKTKNFLIKQGEKIFLETVLIMFNEGVVIPLQHPWETKEATDIRFVGEIKAMLAEIERHRDFRLSNVPLDFLQLSESAQQTRALVYRIEDFINDDIMLPIRRMIYNLTNDEPLGDDSPINSAGVGALYGLFYPLITRYHTRPTELAVQAAPYTYEREVRTGTGQPTKIAGRQRDLLHASPHSDQFHFDHRNPSPDLAYEEDGTKRPRPLNIRYHLETQYQSDVPAELFNSFYLQRCCNLIGRVKDVHWKVAYDPGAPAPDSPSETLALLMGGLYRGLMDRVWLDQINTFAPGDSPLFQYYYRRFNLVPYLNALQFEMQELIRLRQRIVKMGRSVGLDVDLEMLSKEVLQLQDEQFDAIHPSALSPYESPNAPKIDLEQRKKNMHNPDDVQQYIHGSGSRSIHANSLFNHRRPGRTGRYGLVFYDESSLGPLSIKYVPKLPVPTNQNVSSLYTPINIPNLVNYLRTKTYNIRGLDVIVDSLHNAQMTAAPQFYPGLGVHPEMVQQEKFYINALFNPLTNALGCSDDEKYVRGILGALDTVLLRNAAEYQRWVYMVPQDSQTLLGAMVERFAPSFIPDTIDTLQDLLGGYNKVQLHALREANFIDRSKLPRSLRYRGAWQPYTTDKTAKPHQKPVYYLTQPEEPSWTEMLYSLLGWDPKTIGKPSAEALKDIPAQTRFEGGVHDPNEATHLLWQNNYPK